MSGVRSTAMTCSTPLISDPRRDKVAAVGRCAVGTTSDSQPFPQARQRQCAPSGFNRFESWLPQQGHSIELSMAYLGAIEP
ncbi:hypothetical protein THIOKS1860017 [Thiocapsa sp. KS1]|nr:hypothetical protein THIOKS1860017 [Thiocapsa sp. KS1]